MEKKLRERFWQPEKEFRPDLRWWLAEGLNTDETLRKNVDLIDRFGFGGAEFLAMPEPGADSSVYGWGSEEWTSDTRLIVGEAAERGLCFSMTSGAHWANANLPDTYVWRGEAYTPDSIAAAQELDYAAIPLAAGERFEGRLPLPVRPERVESDAHGTLATYTRCVFQGAVAARVLKKRERCGAEFAYAQGEGTGVLDADSLTDLTGRVTGEGEARQLDFTAPDDGDWMIFVYWMHGTCQTASPSVSVNYTINYVDRYGVEALRDYWEQVVLTDEMKALIRKSGRGEIYMDSLELNTFGAGGLLWGFDFVQAFKARKGYDILRWLPLLTRDGVRIESFRHKVCDYTASTEEGARQAARAQDDLFDVLTNMYNENVLRPLQTWLNGMGMKLRAEPSYGMPYEISTPARWIDGIETESFAQVADLDLYRGMLGSANMYGRIFSSETGAVRGHNYYYNADAWTRLCYLQFAGGVSRTVFHGYSAIEGSQNTVWPGHEGMYAQFSERFSCRQPASLHYPEWTRMLARAQKALRQGVPQRDIAILRTDYAFVNYGQPDGRDTFEDNPFMHDEPYFWQDLSLQRAGYTYDYFSPLLLEDAQNAVVRGGLLKPEGPAYQAVIVYQEALEMKAAQALLKLAQAGLRVIFADGNSEIQFHDGTRIDHARAASRARSLTESDEALRGIVAQIEALPHCRRVDSPAGAKQALEELGVRPRVAFETPNDAIIAYQRLDAAENLLYIFVYSYKFAVNRGAAPLDFALDVAWPGAPYEIDPWSGEVRGLGLYTVENGRTRIPMRLAPGEARLLALDLSAAGAPHAVSTTADAVVRREDGLWALAARSGQYEAQLSDGTRRGGSVRLPDPVVLDRWDICVEDWNEGARIENIEEKFGHTTHEVYYETKKTHLHFPDSPLVAWKDLPATPEQLSLLAGAAPSMAHVSGVADYTRCFDLDEAWENLAEVWLCMQDVCGGSVEVWVNGQGPLAVDPRTPRVEIGALLQPGRNEIRIQAASTLTNRMIQRDYASMGSRWNDTFPGVQAHGLRGAVTLQPVAAIPLA